MRLLFTATFVTLLFACGERAAPPARRELRYDGSMTISRLILAEAVPLVEARTGVKLLIDRGGTGTGVRRLFEGAVDVAGVARGLTAEELARKPYFQIIGYDALGIWVNDANPVRDLTRAQVKAVLTGAVTGWKALGGKDLPIQICTERAASGRATMEAVQTMAMDGAPYGRAKELENAADCVQWVAKTPGGVAAASMTMRVDGTRTLTVDGVRPLPANARSSRYVFTRPLLLVTSSAPEGALATLFEIVLSPEGQTIVAKAGLVPVR